MRPVVKFSKYRANSFVLSLLLLLRFTYLFVPGTKELAIPMDFRQSPLSTGKDWAPSLNAPSHLLDTRFSDVLCASFLFPHPSQ